VEERVCQPSQFSNFCVVPKLEIEVDSKFLSESFTRGYCVSTTRRLPAEAVNGAALALQRVDDIKCRHRFAARVLRICDRVADHVLQKNLQNGARLVVNEARDPLHAPAAGKAADGGFRYSLDIVAQNLPVSFSAALAESFAAFRAKFSTHRLKPNAEKCKWVQESKGVYLVTYQQVIYLLGQSLAVEWEKYSF